MTAPSLPADYRVPTFRWSFDPRVRVKTDARRPFRVLLVGVEASDATAPTDVPIRIDSPESADVAFGRSSLAAWMARGWLANNSRSELWVASLSPPTGTAGWGAIIFLGGSVAEPTPLAVYIAGERIEVVVQGNTAVIANTIEKAIDSRPYLPVYASTSASACEIHSKATGVASNSLDIRLAYYSTETLPDGVSMYVQPIRDAIPGTGVPSLATLLGNVDRQRFDLIVHPDAEAANLELLSTFLNARAQRLVGLPGYAITAAVGGFDELLGVANNSRFQSILGLESFPGWGPVRAAAIAAQIALYLEEHPTLPLGNRGALPGLPPAKKDRFSEAERNELLHAGISTVHYTDQNRPELERLITTYRETAAGWPDDFYLDASLIFAEAFLREDYAARFQSRFPNHKLADDGVPAYPATPTVTPAAALADAVAWYSGLVGRGLCDDLPTFRRDSWARRSAIDENRLEIGLAVTLLDQVNEITAAITFSR